MIDPAEMSVLICDDFENMCKSIRGMLKVLNYGKSFSYANNGREAWNLLQKETIDLAIIDWNMPYMTGVELLEHIRGDKKLRDLPVVMITAEANREIVAEAAESDIDAYILKPLTVKSLGEKIAMVVEMANDPPPMIAHLRKARQLEETGNFEAAIEEAMLSIKADPMSSKPIREMGIFFLNQDDLENAERCLLRAATMNKMDVFAFHYLGEIYLKKNDLKNAERFFDKAMSISPRHVKRGIYYGKLLVQNGNTKKAIKVFDKAISLSHEHMALREEIAEYCLGNGIYNYAIMLWEAIIKHTPKRFDLLYQIALAYDKLGDHQNALKTYLEIEKKDKENIDVKLKIAKNFINIGQVFRADEKLKFVLRKDPGNEEAQRLLKENI